MEITIKGELSPESFENIVSEVCKRVRQSTETPAVESDFIDATKLYSTKEAAKKLNISVSSLTSYVKQDIIPGYKPGGKRMFKGSDLLNYVNNGKS